MKFRSFSSIAAAAAVAAVAACSGVASNMPTNQGPNKLVGGCVDSNDGSLDLWAENGDSYHVWATSPATASIIGHLDENKIKASVQYNDQAPELVGGYWFLGLHVDYVEASPFASHIPSVGELTSIRPPYRFRHAANVALTQRYAYAVVTEVCPPSTSGPLSGSSYQTDFSKIGPR